MTQLDPFCDNDEVPEPLRAMVSDEARWNAAKTRAVLEDRRESLGCARAVLLSVAVMGLLVGMAALAWAALRMVR